MNRNYSMIIQWSENDNCFVVTLPEWGELCHTYGDTYEEALNNKTDFTKMKNVVCCLTQLLFLC